MSIIIWCVELFEFLLDCSPLSSSVSSAPPPLSQEGDDYEVIPNSKFYVSRTANKDNSSAYHISGKKATFKEVGALLRSHGIDLDHNRFLILQVILNFLIWFSLPLLTMLFKIIIIIIFIFFLSLLWPSHFVKRFPALHSLPIPQSSLSMLHGYLKVMPFCGNSLLHWDWKGEDVSSATPLDCYSSASWFETMWKRCEPFFAALEF